MPLSYRLTKVIAWAAATLMVLIGCGLVFLAGLLFVTYTLVILRIAAWIFVIVVGFLLIKGLANKLYTNYWKDR